MIRFAQMREFVDYHVIDERRRRLNQPPVEQDAAVGVTCAPTRPGVRQAYGRGAYFKHPRKVRGALFEPALSGAAQPCDDLLSERVGVVRAGANIQSAAIALSRVAG